MKITGTSADAHEYRSLLTRGCIFQGHYGGEGHDCYLSVEAHSILGCLVELWVLQHVLLPARALEYAQGQGGQRREDLSAIKKRRHGL